MKLQTAFLLFGALSSCLCLESEALGYRANGQERKGVRSENTFIDSLSHHRVRKSIDQNKTENITEKINHKYYESQVFRDGQKYWKDIEKNSETVLRTDLSDHYLTKATLKLSFKFPYYGHYLDSVVLTTGGFLYMDVHDTNLITEVQYLAPLMAYFDSKLGENSKVLTLDDGTKLTVQWSNIRLNNNTDVGPFSFQCTLHKNGTIWFAYKQIPVDLDSIPHRTYHPVRVGLSDAFVLLRKDPVRPIIYRYFYIYSQVNISKESVFNGSAVVFHPKPSCVTANSCSQCMEFARTTEFDCQWCPATTRCSDGVDRHFAEWKLSKCESMAVKEITDKRCVAKGRSQSSRGGIGAGAIVVICIVLVLVICVSAWCFYAYRYPTTKSGLYLIELSRRPREFFSRGSSGSPSSIGGAAPSDIKPQVL